MKKFTLIAVFIALTAFMAKSSELRIRLQNNQNCFVELDNQLFGNYSSQHNILNVAPGNRYLKVYTYNRSRRGYNNYNSYRILFQGFVSVPQGVRLNTMINHYGEYVVLSSAPMYINNRTCQQPRNRYHSNTNRPTNQYHNTGYTARAMSYNEFQGLKATIANASFESTRLNIARSATYSNMFTTQQIIEILYMFSFESTKLDFAKLAYNRTIDQNNYYRVNNVFSFESSIRDLNRYIYGF
jgi:hypothetical protein